MTHKYNLGNAISALRILSLLLVLTLAPLSTGSFTYAVNPNQPVTKTSGASSVANDIINPGLDPIISLSSNTAGLFAAANSTAEVKVTSNVTWTASSDQSWLVVSPATGTGNGTLTFTAEANKGGARNATVSIWANGVAVQTIMVTQLQEIPSLTFSSSTSGTLSMYLQFNSNETFYIDWGNGVSVIQTSSTLGNTYSTPTYIAGNVVKIYGDGITNLNGGSRNLTSIDVSQCTDLTTLYLDHNNLISLDVSKNNKLTLLDCGYNTITALDVTLNTQLNYLSLAYNDITSLDVSKNTVLTTLNCISNHLTSLNVRNNAALTTLYCYTNMLSTLDVSNNSLLKLLYCNTNNFNFTTLPQVKNVYTTYNYAPQAKYPITITGNKVDISSQLKATDVNNTQQTTIYKWYLKTGAPLVLGVDYSELNGVFTFLKTPTDDVFCAMTNAAFPGFAGANALRTIDIKVELIKPAVTTQAITGINTTTAVGNGTLTDFGVPNPTSYGVCWNKTGTPSITDSKVDLGVPPSTGAFIANMTGLAPGTTYYVRAFATNLAGTSYGAEFTFNTTGILPTLNTLAVSNITIISATANGNITNLGAPNPTQYGVVWSTATNPTIALATKTTQGPIGVTGAFSSSLTGLLPNTVYYVKAYATNTMGTSYGPEVMFTTLSSTINIPAPTSLSGFTALVGTVSTSQTFVVGGSLVNDLVITAPAGYEVRESGVGSFGSSVSFTPALGILSNKTIEVRLSATAPIGTVSGNVACTSVGAAPQNVSLNGNVTSIQLTITNPTLTLTKIYDGTTGATVTPGTLSGVDPADVANVVLTATATYDNANVGSGKTITVKYAISGSAAYKYAVPVNFTAQGDITPASVTVNAITDTKTYNGTVASVVLPTVGSLIAGDVVNVLPIQAFDNANVGNTHVLTPSGLTIKNGVGADVTGNYTISYVTVSTGVINKMNVTVTAVTDSRIYNGTVISTVSPTVGALATGDVVNVAPTQVYDNATVGVGHTMTPSGLTIKNGLGTDVTGNYTITYTTVATGVITSYAVTITALTDTKIYNGTTASALLPTVGPLAAGDLINVAPHQVFDNANVGNTHVLTPSGLTIKNGAGTDVSANYTINYVNSPATGVITKLALTVTASTDTKTYNGTTASLVSPVVTGVFAAGDVINTNPVQVFDNTNIGTTHILTPSGLTIKNGVGTDVTNNYAITYVVSPATGVINKLGVTVTALTDTKTYNGTAGSLVSPTITGAFAAGDVMNVAPIQVFDNANVGVTHVLTPSGLTIKNGSGADVTNNYAITYVVSPATGVINKLNLNVTAVTDSRIYNGTVISTAIPTVGALATGDVVNVVPTQVYDNATVGAGHTMTPSGLTIKNGLGTDVTSNYTITYTTVATGVITSYAVTVTALTDTKIYNGTTASALLPTVGLLAAGDLINVAPHQVFDNANVGNTHILTPSGLTIKNGAGTDVSANYTITYVNSPATGVITKLGVTVTALTDTKTYNGTTASLVSPVVTGAFAAGDVINTNPIQVFDNANVGVAHVLTPSGLTIKNGGGTDVTGNYTITYTISPATGVINKLGVTVTALTDTKIYNGNTGSVVIPTIGALATGDVVNTAAIQSFDNANVGVAHVLTPSGLTIKNGSGVDVTANYTINYLTNSTGVINKLAITVTAIADTRIYNGTMISTLNPVVGLLAAGDVVNVAPKQVYDNANVGNAHVLTPSGLTIKNGSNADVTGNYTITYQVSPSTGVITAKLLTATNPTLTTTKVYDGNTSAVVTPGTLSGVEPVDAANVILTATAAYNNVSVGNGKTITVTYGLTGTAAGNYAAPLNYTVVTGIITGKSLTVTNPTITTSKAYDGNTSAVVTPGTLSGVDPGDVGNVVITATASYANANVGSGKIITVTYGLTGTAAAIYSIPANYAVVIGVITAKPLTVGVPAITTSKAYDGNNTAVVTPGTLSGVLAGDIANVGLTATATYNNANAGTGKTITCIYTLTGSAAGNYTAPANYVTTGDITGKSLTVTAPTVTTNKVYDGTTTVAITPGTVSGLEAGDVGNVVLVATATYDNSSVGTGKTITITYSLTGSAAGNYTPPAGFTITTGAIAGKPLTSTNPTVTTLKVYNGSTSAVVAPGVLSGVDIADIANVTLSATAAYDNVNVGKAKTITVTYGLTGSAAAIYAVPANYTINTGEITAKQLTASDPILTTSKVYDGSTTAVVSPGVLSGIVGADDVSLTAKASYNNANAGTGKNITCVYTLAGLAAGNYIAPVNYVESNGTITGKLLVVATIKLTTSKVYDGTTGTVFTIETITGVESADLANVILTGTATYDNANAGTGKTITIKYTMAGSASGNYIIPSNYTITTGEITPKALTITNPVVVMDKMFDGNTTAVITTLGSLQGVETVDAGNVTVAGTANYNSTAVGTNKTITVVYTLNGTSKNNYQAPVNLLVLGAKISDNITLSPLVSVTTGCEGSTMDLGYTVLTGTPTQYKITFGATAIAAGIQNVSYSNLPSLFSSDVLAIIIPKGTKDGVYQGTLQMRNELGIESPVYSFTFTINVSTDFIVAKFDDVVLCDNSSNRFVAYQWYKDGVALDGATKQFYNDLDGLIGSYSLKLTTVDGQTLYTCPKVLNIPLAKKVSIYPSPVKANQNVTVKLTGMVNEDLDGAELSIYTMQGVIVYHSTKVQKLNTIVLPPVEGMYVGKVTTSKGQEFSFKVIVIK
ncbi:MAG: YDG domain-containing protein [Paludibacter sp.]|nr:YDG domain-containing protein [Paludibacter sp.]